MIIAPPWFRGFDCIFEYFGVFVFLLIALFAYKATKITKDKKVLWLFISLILIASSFFIKNFRNLNVYFPIEKTINISGLVLKYKSISVLHLLPYIDFSSRALFLLGLVILYFLITNSETKKHAFLITYLITIVIFFSSAVIYVFHLTNAIIFGEISYFYYKKMKNGKNKNIQKIVLTAFINLMLSQVLFLTLDPKLYVSGNVLELVGFSLLLVAYFRILIKSKKVLVNSKNEQKEK